MATLSSLFRQLVTRAPAAPDFPAIGRLIECGDLDAAETRLGALGALASDPYAQMLLARIRREQGRVGEAAAILETLLSVEGESAALRLELAAVARAVGDLAAVREHYETAVAMQPDSVPLLTNLGLVLLELGQPGAAIIHLERARALGATSPALHRSLARGYADLARYAEAEAQVRAEMTLMPDQPGVRLRLAEMLLEQGKLAEGWATYEARLERPDFRWGVKGLPRWDGRRRVQMLRVIAEQGLGDTLMFARFIAAAAERVERVQVLCRPVLERLLASSLDCARIAVTSVTTLSPEIDAHVHLLSLPHALGLGADAVQRRSGYLRADPALVAEWRATVAPHGGLRVGLMWRGNPGNPVDARRSLPIEVAARFREAGEGVTWFNLQVDPDPAQPAPRPFPMVDRPQRDFADSAALIAGLDLVVSVDTSVAHATAALGTPLWLISQFSPGWRWEMGGRENPWYGDVKIFRPGAPREWDPVITRVIDALRVRACA